MIHTHKHIFSFLAGIFIVFATTSSAQDYSRSMATRYGQEETRMMDEGEAIDYLDMQDEGIALEHAVDPDQYRIGPGDRLGINIVATENHVFTLMVGPSGDVLIPAVGVVSLEGMTLTESRKKIEQQVKDNFKNALVNVTLLRIRKFKVQVIGAVRKPGFVLATPVDRLSEVIKLAGGLHKYADETNVIIQRNDGQNETVSLKTFVQTGNLSHNPTFREGDVIAVKFLSEYETEMTSFMTGKSTGISVTGFVRFPGTYKFIPGYSVEDYIGMAGGVLEMGTEKGVKIKRRGDELEVDLGEYVKPGDQIYIEENTRSKIFGNTSVVQTITSIATLILTFVAATR